jgi:hypothetical protein
LNYGESGSCYDLIQSVRIGVLIVFWMRLRETNIPEAGVAVNAEKTVIFTSTVKFTQRFRSAHDDVAVFW